MATKQGVVVFKDTKGTRFYSIIVCTERIPLQTNMAAGCLNKDYTTTRSGSSRPEVPFEATLTGVKPSSSHALYNDGTLWAGLIARLSSLMFCCTFDEVLTSVYYSITILKNHYIPHTEHLVMVFSKVM